MASTGARVKSPQLPGLLCGAGTLDVRQMDPAGRSVLAGLSPDWLCGATGRNSVSYAASPTAHRPLAGAWSDRHDKRRLLIVVQRLLGLQSLALAVLNWQH